MPECVDPTWYDTPMFDLKLLKEIQNKILKEDFYSLCPADPKRIFRVFSMPVDKIKVIIIGQDPYPSRQHANGLAFSIFPTVSVPYSLNIIREDIKEQLEVDYFDSRFDNTLGLWVDSGVFLYNTSLTTLVGKPNSHKHIWYEFTTLFIKYINQHLSNIDICLFGSSAQEFSILLTNSTNRIHLSNHPAAVKHNYEFKGPWRKINHVQWIVPF